MRCVRRYGVLALRRLHICSAVNNTKLTLVRMLIRNKIAYSVRREYIKEARQANSATNVDYVIRCYGMSENAEEVIETLCILRKE